MTDPIRALCAELAAELDHNRRCLLDDATLTHPLADRARAALAEQEADGPAVPEGREPAAIAEQPRPAPPAEGEVAELVEFLRTYGDFVMDEYGDVGEHEQLTRAAELLERHAAPVPVPVAEPPAAPVPTFRDAIQLAQGCHDYSGGYGGTPCAEAFHAGIGTVVNVLTKAASGSWDHQTQAVFAVGADLPLPAPQGGEVE